MQEEIVFLVKTLTAPPKEITNKVRTDDQRKINFSIFTRWKMVPSKTNNTMITKVTKMITGQHHQFHRRSLHSQRTDKVNV